MSTQPPLPGVPDPTPAEPSLAQWCAAWIAAKYPGATTYPRTMREAMELDLPVRYLPPDAIVRHTWWVRKYQDVVVRGMDLVLTDGPGGDRLDQQMALPFFEFQTVSVRKLRLAGADVGAVRRELERYAEWHPQLGLQVDQVMDSWRTLAGL